MSICNLTLPNIFVIGLHGKLGKDLIDRIIECHQFTKSEFPDNYTWLIDNKYYTSTVNFYDVKDYRDLSSGAVKTAEAILIYIDPSQKGVLKEIELILHAFAGKCELDKQILVVDEFEEIETDKHSTGITKLESLNWCISHGFELVELSSDDCEEDKNNEDSSDCSLIGILNIKQSLHAHCWSNLILKDEVNCNNLTLLQAENVVHEGNADGNVISLEVESFNDFKETEVDSFSEMLSTLGDMKIKANSLPNEERKIFAEKMAISFWQSLGGDDEEIRFSNSDSD